MKSRCPVCCHPAPDLKLHTHIHTVTSLKMTSWKVEPWKLLELFCMSIFGRQFEKFWSSSLFVAGPSLLQPWVIQTWVLAEPLVVGWESTLSVFFFFFFPPSVSTYSNIIPRSGRAARLFFFSPPMWKFLLRRQDKTLKIYRTETKLPSTQLRISYTFIITRDTIFSLCLIRRFSVHSFPFVSQDCHQSP